VRLKEDGKTNMTSNQQQWWEMHKLLLKHLRRMPRPKLRQLGKRASNWWIQISKMCNSSAFNGVSSLMVRFLSFDVPVSRFTELDTSHTMWYVPILHLAHVTLSLFNQ
jgi:hypothetical protein